MKKVLGLLICTALLYACNNNPKTAEAAETKPADAPAATARDYEFGDDKFIAIGKKAMADLVKGDIDAYVAPFADNAVYRWNNFDSLAGKAAITDYWKKRRTDVIDSMEMSSQIWLPIKVNAPLTPGQLTGNYALYWFIVKAKYKTGKSIKQRMHMVFHFDASDKIDMASQYRDNAPIMAAAAK